MVLVRSARCRCTTGVRNHVRADGATHGQRHPLRNGCACRSIRTGSHLVNGQAQEESRQPDISLEIGINRCDERRRYYDARRAVWSCRIMDCQHLGAHYGLPLSRHSKCDPRVR